MLVGVGGEGEERFGFADCREPEAHCGSVGAAPGLGCVGDLDTIEEWHVEGAQDGVFEGVDVVHDGAQAGYGV
ncbi:hypothetical protein RBB78_08580 [Tunturiibacter empetritectus]|uniref:hypothetical protein n=1 Tax=Tunturiibacter empetritectus TaxID=3069691 RepID=UPI003D9BC9A6